MPEILPAPSATSRAIFSVLPLAESYSTRTLPIRLLSFSVVLNYDKWPSPGRQPVSPKGVDIGETTIGIR
jgi:hypothetical protein